MKYYDLHQHQGSFWSAFINFWFWWCHSFGATLLSPPWLRPKGIRVCFGTSEPVPGASLLVKSRYVLISSCDILTSIISCAWNMRKKIHVCVFKWKQYDCWWNHQRFLGYYTNHRFWWLNQNMSRLNHHYCCLYPHLGLLNRHFRWLNNHCYCLLVGGLEHFLCFHSVGNFIIPTDELVFLRGSVYHQPDCHCLNHQFIEFCWLISQACRCEIVLSSKVVLASSMRDWSRRTSLWVRSDGNLGNQIFIWCYPLVNIQKTMERCTIVNGKTHYFYGHVQWLC